MPRPARPPHPARPARPIAAALLGALLAAQAVRAEVPAPPAAPLAARLHDTGLYAAAGTHQLAAGVQPFSPQYPLWSDGADKRRWIALPPGGSIDASNPDAWQFPPGTRLWKLFSHQGRPVETRFIERLADGSWRFAAYIWNEAGTEARLAPEAGVAALPVREAPGGRYAVPSRSDCVACHGSAPVPVLGFSALQLSPARDALAPHARPLRAGEVDLRALVASGRLRGLLPALLAEPPRIAAATPVERAALGYLHANCSHCHNSGSERAPVRLTLALSVADPAGSRAAALRSLAAPSRFQAVAADGSRAGEVIAPADPQHSVLALRMQSRDPLVQMPPIGTAVADAEGLALVARWIRDLPSPPTPENRP